MLESQLVNVNLTDDATVVLLVVEVGFPEHIYYLLLIVPIETKTPFSIITILKAILFIGNALE